MLSEMDTDRATICGRRVDIVGDNVGPETERREIRRAGTKIRGTDNMRSCLDGTHSRGGRVRGEETVGEN